MGAKDMVMFEMPDGTKVSNDPRFDLEEALTKSLNSRETTGSVGPTWDEQQAQILATKIASLNSGQPGVGQNAVPDDNTRDLHGVLGSPAMQSQLAPPGPLAADKAKEAGASPKSTSVEDDEPEDSNKRVMEVRENQKKAREAYQRAVDKLGEEGAGDPDKPFSEWTGKQLKAEILRRNADRPEEQHIKLEGKKVSDAVAALEADNAAQQGGSDAGTNEE